MRGETGAAGEGERPDAFQSTPLMRGETDGSTENRMHERISIHSPHARGDGGR